MAKELNYNELVIATKNSDRPQAHKCFMYHKKHSPDGEIFLLEHQRRLMDHGWTKSKGVFPAQKKAETVLKGIIKAKMSIEEREKVALTSVSEALDGKDVDKAMKLREAFDVCGLLHPRTNKYLKARILVLQMEQEGLGRDYEEMLAKKEAEESLKEAQDQIEGALESLMFERAKEIANELKKNGMITERKWASTLAKIDSMEKTQQSEDLE